MDKCDAAYNHQHNYWQQDKDPKKEDYGPLPPNKEMALMDKIFGAKRE